MPRMIPTAADELRRVMDVNFVNFDGLADIEEIVSRSWASITFSGELHHVQLRLQGENAGEAADAFLAGLTEREFDLRGHILADIALVAEDRDQDGEWVRLALEALTVEAS